MPRRIPFRSKRALDCNNNRWCCALAHSDKSWAISFCVVAADIPLLISRPAQRSMNLTLHMGKDKADFYALKVMGITLGQNLGGHPPINIAEFPSEEPSNWSGEDLSACENGEVHLPWRYKKSTMTCMDALRDDVVVANNVNGGA